MEDKFHALTIREAIAVQIFYSSPDDENLHGKMLNGKSWFEPVGEVVDVTFRESDVKKDEALEKLVKERAYAQILKQYNKPGATYKIVVIYKDEKGEHHDANLTNILKLAMSPEELPAQIISFLLDQGGYEFLKS